MLKMPRHAKILENEAEPSVKVRDDPELTIFPYELAQDLRGVGIEGPKLPGSAKAE